MKHDRIPDAAYIREEAGKLTEQAALAAASDLERVNAKLAAARGRFSRQLAKLELLRLVLKAHIAGEQTGLDGEEIKIAAFPFHYLIEGKDLIPDSIPGAGFSDDVAVVVVVWEILYGKLLAFAKAKGLPLTSYFDINDYA